MKYANSIRCTVYYTRAVLYPKIDAEKSAVKTEDRKVSRQLLHTVEYSDCFLVSCSKGALTVHRRFTSQYFKTWTHCTEVLQHVEKKKSCGLLKAYRYKRFFFFFAGWGSGWQILSLYCCLFFDFCFPTRDWFCRSRDQNQRGALLSMGGLWWKQRPDRRTGPST